MARSVGRLDETWPADYIVFTFDPEDTTQCYIVPFQHLRLTFAAYSEDWTTAFNTADQDKWGLPLALRVCAGRQSA